MSTEKIGFDPLKQTVLIVDDEFFVREIIVDQLSELDCNFLHAEDGVAALEVLACSTVDVALLDIRMPRMSGLDLLKTMSERYPAVVNIMLTASNEKESILTALKYHVFDFIEKPFQREFLINRVRNALAKQEYREKSEAVIEEFLIQYCGLEAPDKFYNLDYKKRAEILDAGMNLALLKNYKRKQKQR